jgi:hypothetical protein
MHRPVTAYDMHSFSRSAGWGSGECDRDLPSLSNTQPPLVALLRHSSISVA